MYKLRFITQKDLSLVDDIYCARYLEYTDISFISEEYLSLTNQKMANKFIKLFGPINDMNFLPSLLYK